MTRFPLITVLLVLAAFAVATQDRYLMDVFVLTCLYGTMAVAWNLAAGFTGLLSLGHSLFIGIGAYTVAYGVTAHGLSPWVMLPAAVVIAVACALAIGVLCFRYGLKGYYFGIATLAFSEIAFFLVSAAVWLGRSDGLMLPAGGEPWISLQFRAKWPYGLMILVILLATLIGGWALLRSKTGYYWRSIRDNEEAAEALGVPIFGFKLFAFALSAGIVAICGAFYATYVAFVDPRSVLGVELSIQLLVFSIIGGMGLLWGPLLGAAILIPASELLRIWVGGAFYGVNIVVYASLLIVLALFLPQGLGALRWRRRVS